MLSRIWVNRASENSLQAFHKRFSRPIRALPSELAGADGWRATTYGHGVLQTNPLGSALDQECPPQRQTPNPKPVTPVQRRHRFLQVALIQAPPPTVHAAPASYSGDLDGQRTTMKTERL